MRDNYYSEAKEKGRYKVDDEEQSEQLPPSQFGKHPRECFLSLSFGWKRSYQFAFRLKSIYLR